MQPQYPAQFPQQPQYPTQPQYPAYPQTQAPPAYPQQPAYPQGYAQPQYAPPAPPAAPLPTGSLDTFYQQPSSGGGPSFKFMDANRQPQIGKTYAGFVARPITDADVRAQTNNGQVITYKDGRPKFVLVVPMVVQPDAEFPEGVAGWWVKGQARDELARAMAEAGAPVGAPESGAFIQVTLVGTRPVPGMNPAFQYRINYVRPQGAAPAPAPQPVAQPAPMAAPVAPPVQAPPPVMAPPPVQQMPAPVPMAQPAPQAVAPPVPQPAQVAAPAAAPQGFSDEQAALFARLTGGSVPQAAG